MPHCSATARSAAAAADSRPAPRTGTRDRPGRRARADWGAATARARGEGGRRRGCGGALTLRRRVRDAQAGPARGAVERAGEDAAAAADEEAAVAAPRPREGVGVVRPHGGCPAVLGFGELLCLLRCGQPKAGGNEAQGGAAGLAVSVDADKGPFLL